MCEEQVVGLPAVLEEGARGFRFDGRNHCQWLCTSLDI